VVLVRTDYSEERIAPIIRVTRISELGTTSAVATEHAAKKYIIFITLMMEAMSSSETA
jgi:hypothetical protein